jgi:hypothetical protein
MRTLFFATAAVLAAAAPVSSFGATLIGSTIEANYYFPDTATVYSFTNSPQTFVVGAGVDGSLEVEGVTFLRMDFSADTLVLTLDTVLTSPTWNSAAQNGPGIKVTSGPEIVGFDIVGETLNGTVTGSLNGGLFLLNWAGASYVNGDTVTVRFALSDGPGEVPLPGALPLFASVVGVAGLAAWRRRKNAASPAA